jgi:long-chain acyl-CoA synthetase
MVSGSAPMPLWLLERFHAIGLPVLEAYGVSENIVPVAINRPDCFRFGSVGQPAPGSEVWLAEDGELLVRGSECSPATLAKSPRPAPRRRRLPGHRRFREHRCRRFRYPDRPQVGDLQDLDRSPHRAGGIESQLQQVPEVEHAVVFGARRAQPVALLVLGEEAWQAGAGDSFIPLRRRVIEVSESLPAYQRPAGLLITMQPLTIAGGELTSNLKLRRHVIESRRRALQTLYAHLDAADGARFEAWNVDRQSLFFCRP